MSLAVPLGHLSPVTLPVSGSSCMSSQDRGTSYGSRTLSRASQRSSSLSRNRGDSPLSGD